MIHGQSLMVLMKINAVKMLEPRQLIILTMKEVKSNFKIRKNLNQKPCNTKVVELIERRKNQKMSRMEVFSVIA